MTNLPLAVHVITMDTDHSNSDRSSSDGQGSEFHPNSEIRTGASTTLSRRLYDGSVSNEAKKRVLAVDPHKGRCLIQNCNPARAVEFAHCYPRRLTKDSARMASLEYWWDMKYHTLNLDTRYNIFPVNASLHHMFDKPNTFPSWTLLPTDEVIMKFWNTLERGEDGRLHASRGKSNILCERCPLHLLMYSMIVKDKNFRYRLITLPESMLKGCVITRQHAVTGDDTPSLDHFRLYAYPFHDYPIVESHLRPHFVILEAGRKVKQLPIIYIPALLAQHPILGQVSQLYESWTAALPKRVLADKKFNPPSSQEDSEDEDDNKTAHGRYKNPRKRFGDDGSPTKLLKHVRTGKGDDGKGGKRKRDAEVEVVVDDEMGSRRYEVARNAGPFSRPSRRSWSKSFSLSGETLRDHNKRVGKVPTSQRIPEWLDACPVPVSL
ncbi:hypothetical protein JVT61DRAFT_8044 [Boletus reticuloceps]|uniref:HNH nuclease domain-containing protein n=1 Tax=Boletus reticuloceps TaxID=495285 RepID=A0A8I3A6P5_9AGAM|nr:hypothetical protein JVT61DRAFT_8044 [Boletus reticuloceps]